MLGKNQTNKKFKIMTTAEHELLNPFYAANDLEIAEDEPVSTDTLKSWVIMDSFLEEGQASHECITADDAHGASDEKSFVISGGDPLDEEGAAAHIKGACTLAFREGEYIIDGIALDEAARGLGAGTALLEAAEDEVRSRGGDCVYLVARAPEFFRINGYETTARDDAPEFFECFGCDQYNKTCFPEVMKHVL